MARVLSAFLSLLASQRLAVGSEPFGLGQLVFVFLACRACAFLLRLNLLLVFAALLLMSLGLLEACELGFMAVRDLFLILICLFQQLLLEVGLLLGLVCLVEGRLIFI